MKLIPLTFFCCTVLLACNQKTKQFDASGTFEADEIMVAAQQSGQIQSLNIHEGQQLTAAQAVGSIDVKTLELQKQQVEAQIISLKGKLNVALPQTELVKKQIAVQQSQLAYLLKEQTRTENLVKADAASQKQLDDITAKVDEAKRQLAVSQQQINLNQSNVGTQNRSVLSEQGPLQKSLAQIQSEIDKGVVVNPVKGTVLTQYAYAGEMTSVGKSLYKIANLDTIILRAYITGGQLPTVRLGQSVTVSIDDGKGGFKNYKGSVQWISDKAEFTPKTIQTKDERQNLVYAIKVYVPNDGYLKIGMYGEINF